jgi:hypothetical protein
MREWFFLPRFPPCLCSRFLFYACMKIAFVGKTYNLNLRFVSVYHRTIQINHQPAATIFQFIILTFIYSLTCFGPSPALHQELNDCSSSLWFYLLYYGDSRAVFVVGPVITGPTTNTVRLSLRYEGKTRGCHCSHWAPDDGRENARNMLSSK